MTFEWLAPSDFVGDVEEYSFNGPESPLNYYPGGFHPIALGNVIASPKTRYHVRHKLGWGGYATVWLVQDLESYSWNALRVRRSDCSCEGEDEVLDFIRSMPQSSHLPTISDVFTIDGPNGRHTAIVTDIVVPLGGNIMQQPSVRSDLKTIMRGIVESVARLHESGIVHGDLHIRNVGLAVTVLNNQKLEDGSLHCPIISLAELQPVISDTKKALSQSAHFPPYVVSPIDMTYQYEKLHDAVEAHVVKLFDFGNAHLVNKPRITGGFLSSIAPPEWELNKTADGEPGVGLSTASGIWALGLLIFNAMSGGRSLFSRWKALLSEIAKHVGFVPSSWDAFPAANRLDLKDINPANAEALWKEHRKSLRETCPSDEDVDALIALLRRILVLDPAARPSAMDILRDLWFSIPMKRVSHARQEIVQRSSAHHFGSPPGPYYAQQFPPILYPHNNGFAPYPGQYGPFYLQPMYLPPPPIHPAVYAHPHPLNPHAPLFIRLSFQAHPR